MFAVIGLFMFKAVYWIHRQRFVVRKVNGFNDSSTPIRSVPKKISYPDLLNKQNTMLLMDYWLYPVIASVSHNVAFQQAFYFALLIFTHIKITVYKQIS